MNKNTNKQSKYLIIRIMFLTLGMLSFILGTIGIFLPILPTTPLYLLTSYCFVKGSKKFNDWFVNTKLYIKYVSGFVEHKTMSIFGMVILLSLVSTMLILTMILVNDVLVMAIFLNILLLVKYTYFIMKVKVVSKAELNEMKQMELQYDR